VTARVHLDLRRRLDEEPLGFPSTESQLDLRLLEAIFTEEEARGYLELGALLEEPSAVARRVGSSVERLAGVLDGLARKGLVRRRGGTCGPRYAAIPFALGAFEFELRSEDAALGRLFDRYYEEAYGRDGVFIDEPIRVVPVERSLEPSRLSTRGDMRALVARADVIAVSRCVCRVQQKLLGRGCAQSEEACFQFGRRARQVAANGSGRIVTREEALAMLERCERAGLVSLAFVAEGGGGLCNCCGDCCLVLRAIKLRPAPARGVSADHRVEVNPESCSACSACLGRCQMEALYLGEAGVPEVDRNRCIGCGLCVTTCPERALSLRERPESERAASEVRGGYLMQLARQDLRDFVATARE
jgi:electron transport complex protein RnfB